MCIRDRIRVRGWYEVDGEKQRVDSRDKVKRNGKSDKSFIKTIMKVGERQ